MGNSLRSAVCNKSVTEHLHVEVKEVSFQTVSVINAIQHCCASVRFCTVYICSDLLSRQSTVEIVREPDVMHNISFAKSTGKREVRDTFLKKIIVLVYVRLKKTVRRKLLLMLNADDVVIVYFTRAYYCSLLNGVTLQSSLKL